MIAHLRGKLISKHPNQAVVEAGGVGYDVAISVPTFSDLPTVGSEVSLHVHTHVREDVIALFGFATALELDLFERLIAISGIGPKLALAVLSGIDPAELVRAIRAQDVARLTRIPGVGKKTAERIGLELKDRLPQADAHPEPAAGAADDRRADLLSALTNLGYKGAIAEKAVDAAVKKAPDAPFEVLLRDILRGMVR